VAFDFKVVERAGSDYHAWKRLRGVVEQLKRGEAYVKAGILAENADKPDGDKGDVTTVEVAMFNEFGTVNAPARSFIREPFEAMREGYLKILRETLPGIVSGKTRVSKVLNVVGQAMVRDMKAAIQRGIPPPNAESTIALKGSSKPLIDTGDMISRITHEAVVPGEARKS
jgi:hypothetical protein